MRPTLRLLRSWITRAETAILSAESPPWGRRWGEGVRSRRDEKG